MDEIVTLAPSMDVSAGSVLVVVAHPDDETLGAGATIHRLARSGLQSHVCILSGSVDARNLRPDDALLRRDALNAMNRLGVASAQFGDFPNIKMNTVPHLEMVQFIESAMERVSATSIITHHPGDINDDHRQVSVACQAAARLPQRRVGTSFLRSLLYMEVPSSTDWAFGEDLFRPTLFQEVEEEDIDAKLEALSHYTHVMRPHPHPRSEETIRALSLLRGSQSGVNRAEAFSSVYVLRQEAEQWK